MTGRALLACAGLLGGWSCARPLDPLAQAEAEPPQRLSEWRLFEDGAAQRPAGGVVPYDVNSALFADYAAKYRFVRLPPGTRARYEASETFELPVGTVLVKTFAFDNDLRHPAQGRRLIETRLLVRRSDGWRAWPYVWDEGQREAYLTVEGGTRQVSWLHSDGRPRTNRYIVPNVNQCQGCHQRSRVMEPIGIKARHLNRDFDYQDGRQNQLRHWSRQGLLDGAPAPERAPRLAAADDPASGSLDERARAWLEINCAHCHDPRGPAASAGLDLRASQTEAVKRGIWKTPVAAGRGSGGRLYDIVPGRPEESILLYRIASTDPGVMMPELPRRLVDEEGVALIRAWIAAMDEAAPQRAWKTSTLSLRPSAPKPTTRNSGLPATPSGKRPT